MLDRPHVSMGDPVEGEDTGLDWYMNKSFKSRTVKVLSSVHGGYCKMRFMVDLLRGHDNPHHAWPTQPKTGVSACKGSPYVSDATKPAYDANTDRTEDDEDDDIANMTLKEMRQLFKKSVQKSLEKQRFSIPSSVCRPWGNAPAVDRMPISDCCLQSSGLELHLDSSTSNSAESSDDVSPRGIATSFHKPIDSMVHDSEVVVQVVECPGQPLKKRKSTMDLVVCKGEISVEDDDCTLEMWQVHKSRSYVGKKSRRCGLDQAPGMDEQTSCDSSMTPATTSVLSSANLAPGIDDYLFADSTCPFDVTGALGKFEQGSSAPPCSFDQSEDLRKNSLEPQSGLITSATEMEGGGFKSDKPHSDVSINKISEISSEDVKNDEKTQQHSLLLCESSLVCSSGESLQGDESKRIPLSTEAPSWLLKPCSKSVSVEVSASIHGKFESNVQEPTFSCIDHVSSLATMVESGQSTLVDETRCSINKANSAASSMKSFIPPIGITNELVNNEVADLSQKNCDGILPVDLSNNSPPLSAKLKFGFSIGEQSINNVSMASRPLLDEDTSGSPVSLFSTERLDTEEDQELEQVNKPSKIPSKRKAISPLSRERLLQASKYGDREQNFTDLDKRGLKKLPRAFKGFIGRDTFNQERLAAFCRAKSSTTLESSPPEKPQLKEEVLPGSPCHNREKFLPSKHLAPKISSISSSYGSSSAAAIVAPTMQTSSPSPSYVQRLSLVLNSSPSPPSHKNLKAITSKSSPLNSSPPVPAKGILRSSSPTCQGACKCEECISLRSRAEKAAEFSQRQMHDIEGLAVKLLKELNSMRCVVEESLIHRNAPRADSPRSAALSLEQVKKATNNAFETEKMAKSWLVRMARDCNRYCKIMRMQERKLTFADESGGQLCHVKLFHAQAQAQPDTMLSTEKPTMSSSVEKGDVGLTDEPALEVASQ